MGPYVYVRITSLIHRMVESEFYHVSTMNSDATLIAGALVKHARDDRSFVLLDPIANESQGFTNYRTFP